MTISQRMSLKSVISREDIQLSPAQIGYFNARVKSKAHAAVLGLFNELSHSDGMTRAFVARRLGKKPEQITRWLGTPGNWTLDTLSNLLAAMGHEAVISVHPLDKIKQGNYHHPLASSISLQSPEIKSFSSSIIIEDEKVFGATIKPSANSSASSNRVLSAKDMVKSPFGVEL